MFCGFTPVALRNAEMTEEIARWHNTAHILIYYHPLPLEPQIEISSFRIAKYVRMQSETLNQKYGLHICKIRLSFVLMVRLETVRNKCIK